MLFKSSLFLRDAARKKTSQAWLGRRRFQQQDPLPSGIYRTRFRHGLAKQLQGCKTLWVANATVLLSASFGSVCAAQRSPPRIFQAGWRCQPWGPDLGSAACMEGTDPKPCVSLLLASW